MEFLDEIIEYGGHAFLQPVLSDTGYDMVANSPAGAVLDASNPIYQSFNRPYDIFNMRTPRKPMHVGYVFNYDAYGFDFFDDVRVLDMPIKLPGQVTYAIPDELEPYIEILQGIIDHEHAINPRAKDYYCYLTIDQAELEHGDYHRNEGVHVEGFQGPRLHARYWAEHHYHAVDCFPTEFFIQGVDLGSYDPLTYDVFDAMTGLADPSKIWKPKPYEIVLTDCYTMRREPKITEYTTRTFFRVTYSVRQYDRLGNTWNPLLGTAWPMTERAKPAGLVDPFAVPY